MQFPILIILHQEHFIFGGPMSVNDCDDFIRREIEWVGVPLRDNKPFLGICLGAQICAKFMGGKVFRHPSGHAEVGYYPVRPTAAGLAVVESWPECVYQWHREGFDLPHGCELLAEGDIFEIQAIRFGRAFALQFHDVHRWTTTGHERMALPGAKPRHTRRQRQRSGRPIAIGRGGLSRCQSLSSCCAK